MRRPLIVVVAACCSALSFAHAADLPVKARPLPPAPVASWAGFYVGGNVGYGWAGSDPALVSALNFAPGTIGVQIPLTVPMSRNGIIGGGQLGYTWQWSNIVAGLEADLQGSDIHGTATYNWPGPGTPVVDTFTSSIDWFGTVRGRLGLTPQPALLLYVTGGFAYGGTTFSTSTVATPATLSNFHGSTSATRTGWAAGVGGEWAVAAHWTVKAEYLHVDLGSTTVTSLDPAFPISSITYALRNTMDIGRAGFNFRF